MTGREVRRVRKSPGLRQRQFAARVGVTSNTVARWESDELTVGSTAAVLMRLLGQLHREEGKRR
jgi:DNA-binding transcriptional regulator YiaG